MVLGNKLQKKKVADEDKEKLRKFFFSLLLSYSNKINIIKGLMSEKRILNIEALYIQRCPSNFSIYPVTLPVTHPVS